MIRLGFFLILISIGIYNTYIYKKDKDKQAEINRYNRSEDEEFDITS